jgi:hypothetical protein
VILRIALIEPDDSFIRVLGGKSPDLRAHALKRREVLGLITAEIDAVNTPVLVTTAILQVEDMLVGVSPGVASNAAMGALKFRG